MTCEDCFCCCDIDCVCAEFTGDPDCGPDCDCRCNSVDYEE